MGYLRRIKNRERRIEKAKNRKLYNTPKETSVRSRLRRQHAAELKQKLEIKEQQEAQIAAREMADYKEVNETVAKDPEAYEKFLEKEGVEVPEMYVDQRLDDDYIKVEDDENDGDSENNGSDADSEDVGSTSESNDSQGGGE